MSDVRLSNASPTVERVDARQQENIRPVRRVLFGTPDREETRRYAEAVMQENAQDFMEKYNFDPVNDVPLPPGRFVWEEDRDAPDFYRREPRNSKRPQRREADSPTDTHRTQTAHLRKRRSLASSSCSHECPRKRSCTDEDDDEDHSYGAGGKEPSRPENNVDVP